MKGLGLIRCTIAQHYRNSVEEQHCEAVQRSHNESMRCNFTPLLAQPTPKGGEMCTLWFALSRLSPNRFSRRSWRTRRTSRSRLVFRHSKCDTARNNPRPAYSSNARTSNTNDNVKLFDVRIAASSISFCRDFASSRRHRPPHRYSSKFQFSYSCLSTILKRNQDTTTRSKQILGFTGTRTDILCPVVESNFRSSLCGLD